MNVKELGHIVLYVSDLRRSRRFSARRSVGGRSPLRNEIELYIDVQPARWKEDPGVMFSDPVARPLRL